MTSRVTRSSARLAANPTADNDPSPPAEPSTTDSPASTVRPPAASRKRKASAAATASTSSPTDATSASTAVAATATPSSRRSKKARLTDSAFAPAAQQHNRPSSATTTSRRGTRPSVAMSGADYDDGDLSRSANRRRQSPHLSEEDTAPASQTTSRRRSSRKKTSQRAPSPSASCGNTRSADTTTASQTAPASSSRRGSKKSSTRKSLDPSSSKQEPPPDPMDEDNEDEEEEDNDPSDELAADEAAARRFMGETDGDDDPFSSGFLGRSGMPSGLSNTLRALSGMMSGMTTRLRGILENLRCKADPTVQMIALTELSEILLVSNEDNLAGHFSPDQYVKELVILMQPSDFGEENPEMMLLACRCIANLMEALPAATASVVYGGAVPVLCQKLLEIHYIDVAEQALSTLEKISVDFPSSIVREGGLTACLTYLDFFATSTQRTAVTTAANCCRNIPEDSFPVVRDVMPILLNVLGSSDQRVVEQGSLCVTRIIESFRYQEDKLEELVSPELLQAMLRLLLPGTTNMIGPNIHTQFLRVLAITARASPRLAVELLKMNVVDTLYQILTGVSPPEGVDDVAAKIDKNIIMQALIRSPRDQIFETLNVICEILPTVSHENLMFLDHLTDAGYTGSGTASMAARARTSPNDKRLDLLKNCQDDVRRFAVVLFPTLTHAYTSTVNLSVRQKVLTAQLKMLSNLDTSILTNALSGVTYASHLASILTQQENSTLVTFALQVAELLLKRLESIYRPQFYREGVMAEITKLAQRPLTAPVSEQMETEVPAPVTTALPDRSQHEVGGGNGPEETEYHAEGSDGEPHNDGEGEDQDEDVEDDEEDSDDGSLAGGLPGPNNHSTISAQDVITTRAAKFIEAYAASNSAESGMQQNASQVMENLRNLANELRNSYLSPTSSGGHQAFVRLANYFDSEALETITSYELLTSGIVEALLKIFTSSDPKISTRARSDFVEAFMSCNKQAKPVTGNSTSPTTAFSVLVFKLQDLLSRNEHFKVITINQNAFDSSRSSAASMLAKQLRIKLAADEGSGIPRAYRNIMVSIHAIATFRALDDYLRPRISLAERATRNRDAMLDTQPRASAPGVPGSGVPQSGDTLQSKTAKPSNPASTSAGVEKGSLDRPRRSSRRASSHKAKSGDASQTPTGPPAEETQHELECADEAPLDDEEEDDEDDTGLDIVDDLDTGMDPDLPDPSAVNLEVANTGRVTAHREDGTRVSTPLQGSQTMATSRLSAAASLAAAREMLGSPSSQSRTSAYAAAMSAGTQDWHIEFSIDGQPLSNDTTIYRAVHFNQSRPEEVSSRNVWSNLHKISFKRVPGPPPAERSLLSSLPETPGSDDMGLPPSLTEHPITASILRLMSILHQMNVNLEDVLAEKQGSINLSAEPLTQFVNTKLTAKLNRQLEEPLIVASNCLPTWSEDLARLYPFLFPFETRHLFLGSTSFGYSRSMTRWQNSQPEPDSRRHRDERPFLGRLQRQKVRISRSRILESAIKVMELYGSSPSILEVEYFEEVGTGLGPTLEFYSTVSKEFSKKKIKLWRENEATHGDEFAFGLRGLFPAPMSDDQASTENGKRVIHLFRMLGKFVARSMLDSRIIDVSLNPTFFRVGDGSSTVMPSLGAVASVDKDLAQSLKYLMHFIKAKREIDEDSQLSASEKAQATRHIRIKEVAVEDIGLDFTLPGYPSINLQPNGSKVDVTIQNVESYVNKVIDFTLQIGVKKQVQAFQAGFSQVFPYSALKAFTPDELVMLFGRSEEDWSLETLMDSIKADHGFNLDSASVRNLLHVMSQYTTSEQRDFLQFVTGSPKLPIGGFKSLTPMFTVVCKPSEPPFTSDDYLPSVMTCVNYLKMPNYSTIDILREKLGVAIREGQGAFHLS